MMRVVVQDALVEVGLRRTEPLHHADEPIEVGAGAERLVAGAAQDRDVDGGIVVDVLPGVGETHEHLGVDGVPDVRTVHRDERDAVLLLVEDCGFRHLRAPRTRSTSRSTARRRRRRGRARS